MFRLKMPFAGLFGLLLLSACVTINVYFPAAAAEKAADRLIQEVWDSKRDSATPAPTETPEKAPEKPKANPEQPQSRLNAPLWLGHALEWLVVPAQAATADFNVSTPAIEALKTRMKQRFAVLEAYYNHGALGLSNDALIVLRNAAAVPLRNRNKITQESDAENRDRLALYQAIADANGHPEWVGQIRSTFAQRWISNAQKGWWYQNTSGQWLEK